MLKTSQVRHGTANLTHFTVVSEERHKKIRATLRILAAPVKSRACRAKMEGVSQVLQFPIIIERIRPFSFDPQAPQELDFMRSGIAGQRSVLKKFPESRFFLRLVGLSLNILEFLGISRRESPAQCNLHSEGCKVDIPGQ